MRMPRQLHRFGLHAGKLYSMRSARRRLTTFYGMPRSSVRRFSGKITTDVCSAFPPLADICGWRRTVAVLTLPS